MTALCIASCTSDAVTLDPVPTPAECPCVLPNGTIACPAGFCGLRVLVDEASCKGKVGTVEVFIEDTLEPKSWQVGTPRLACRAIPVGGTATVFARADTPWKWQSKALSCDAALGGSAIEHILECKTGG